MTTRATDTAAGVVGDLGDFLRAMRTGIDPADVGMPAVRRRTAGLRREEVAVLAGVSVDYYARLEQGRERNPSAQVVDALGQALRLSADARGHMFRLAGLNPRLGPDRARDHVHPSLVELLDAFPTAAAYVLGPSFDVLAANAAATALLQPFIGSDTDAIERGTLNMVRVLFTHPAATTVFVDWSIVAAQTVEALRLNAGKFPNDPEVVALVDDLSRRAPSFSKLWDSQRVGALSRAFKVFVHPTVGRIELTYQTFDTNDAPGQQLLVGTPAVGSTSADALSYLAAMSADTGRTVDT